jgi:hypothetical protein
MVCIVVNDDQAKLIRDAGEGVMLRDSQGQFLGFVQLGLTDEEFAEAKRVLASDSPRYTTDQVLAHLKSLEGR